MKQSNNNKKSRDVTAFLYERLSRDDNMDGESYSIGNQDLICQGVFLHKSIRRGQPDGLSTSLYIIYHLSISIHS